MRRLLTVLLLSALAPPVPSFSRDVGQWADASPEQREFFDGLRNSNDIQCCHNNDGYDAAWEVRGGDYYVMIENEWRRVPPQAVLNVRNKYGIAKVWYTRRWQNEVLVFAEITCFLRGTES